ncbi:MAG: ATP-binding protein [Magnetococcus sp. YQC-3]
MSLLQMNEKKIRIPKKQVMGELLLNKIFERDFSKGGQFIYCSGSQGSGKTSLCLGFATRILKQNPAELLFWRESLNAPVQFTKYNGSYQVLAERRFPLEVREITNNRRLSKDIPIRYFEGFKQLMNMSIPGCLNIIYFKEPAKWTDFIKHLIVYPNFKTVFLDEMEDVCPEFSGGDTWRKNKEFAEAIKQVRKGCITLIGNSQNISDCDHRIRKKATMFIYLHGATVDDVSPVKKQAVQSLRIGGAWIDFGHAEYGQIVFPPFEPKPKSYVIEEANSDD